MAARDDQLYPLAPPIMYPRSHAEQFASTKPKSSLHKQHSSKIPVYCLAFLVFTSAILLILASIFLRIRTPDIEISSAIVRNLSYKNGSSSPSLTMSLVNEVSIKNTNFGSFMYEKSYASFYYGSMPVGSTNIGQGHAKARGRKKMNITTDVSISGLSNATELKRDIALGMLELTSYAKLSGKIRVKNFVNKKRSPEMNCTMTLNLKTRAFQDLICN